MKLAKLSLAAIIAVGAFSTANAANLEEAIKGVELKGFLRYRFYSDSINEGTLQGSETHRYSYTATAVMPVADNLKAAIGFSYDDNEYAANAANTAPTVSSAVMYFKYATKDYSLTAGRMAIATPWTESGFGGSKGNGAVAMYTAVPGWAFAAAGFVSTSGTAFTNGENLYAAAAIGAMGPVNLQVWVAKMTNVFDSSIFAQVDTNMAGFSLKAQMNVLSLESVPAGAEDTGTFYGAEIGYSMDNFGLAIGYTSTDDDQPIYTLDADDDGMLKYGQQIYGDTVNAADADTMAIVANAKFGAFGVEAGYVDVEIGNVDADELYGLVKYKYSKNFGLQAYYSVYDTGTTATDNDEFRFEAKYSF
jgi:hypothetical protein